MRILFRITVLLSLTVVIFSCSTGACYDDIDPLMNVTMYADGTDNVLKADSVKVIGELSPHDTTLVDLKSVSSFSFMLNPASQSVTLYISINGLKDTAIISYDSYPHLVSSECGYTLFNEIKSVSTTHHIIDSLFIENKNVTLNGERNLRLFY